MSTIQIISAADFIDNLTLGKLDTRHINRAVAYLRAKGIAFYDKWSKEHCLRQDQLLSIKPNVMMALNAAL